FLGPVSEELLFRGFLFRGIAASRAGWIAAILIPNLLWVGMHSQYAAPALTALFVAGCVYGFARHLSGSVVLPILLHMAQNALVTYATFFLRGSG
ncbi:MAG: CPBP family intramembrane glutamic endopeptidase, partial [Chthoniobacteraceae bacterium]